MITGDGKDTACNIAQHAGILDEPDVSADIGIAMSGQEIEGLSQVRTCRRVSPHLPSAITSMHGWM